MSTITTRAGKGSGLTNTEMDNNFTNLNTDKYEENDNISVGDVVSSGDHTFSLDATISAAGTVQGDATSLTKTFNVITTATANQGVILPNAMSGLRYTVINGSGAEVNIYPAVGHTINNGTSNSPIVIPDGSTKFLVGTSTTNWDSMVETAVYSSTGIRLN